MISKGRFLKMGGHSMREVQQKSRDSYQQKVHVDD